MADKQQIVAYTHTGLRDRPKRLWTFGDIPLPGVSIPGLGAGVVVFLAVIVLSTLVQQFTGGPVVLVGAVLGLVAGWGAYAAWGADVSDLGGTLTSLTFWLDYRFRQPRVIVGAGADTEPAHLHWQAILWEPTDPGWIARRDATYLWLVEHAPAGTALATSKGTR